MLTGAIDIVFVEQPDGSFKSTPFYVKFGKIGVLKAKEKTVEIEINGTEIPLCMVLDDFGIAHFPTAVRTAGPEATTNSLCASQLHTKEEEEDSATSDASPLKRIRRNSEPSPGEADHNTWEELTGEVGLGVAGRALSDPDLSAETRTTAGEGHAEEVLQLRPQELAAYNLRPGINDAVFSITTQFQGESLYEQHCRLRQVPVPFYGSYPYPDLVVELRIQIPFFYTASLHLLGSVRILLNRNSC
jgi:phosphatidate phosphatase PAH1